MTARSRFWPARPPSAIIIASARGNRLFELGLGDVALAFTADLFQNRPASHC
jgi:hypothetical protein